LLSEAERSRKVRYRLAMRTASLLLFLGALGCDGTDARDASIDTAALDTAALDTAALDTAALDTAALDAPRDAGATRCAAMGAPSLDGVVLTPITGVPTRDGFAPGFGIVEGPVWVGDALLVSHFGGGPTPMSRIYRVLSSGAVSVAIADAGTNGLALGRDGTLYAASHALGAIVILDPRDLSAPPVPLFSSYLGARFNGPNDLVVRSDGGIYFTDPDYQAPSPRPQSATRVYRSRAPDGAVTAIEEDLTQPNGVALSLDERTLFVGHAGGLVRYPLNADGSVAGPRVSIDAITAGVDGLGRDCAGNLYVTSDGEVVVLDPAGGVIGTLSAPGATNVAFGGPDGRTLYVTSLGNPPALRSAILDIPGLPD
jgi:gluconolactonase